eukprot:GHVN01080547.1.p1 GENE.GHVN01080547.1~~GHVN01080547.1.p1  ORF type:complete len:182 (+),score=22.74 GHVN01080547.1:70-615(+)
MSKRNSFLTQRKRIAERDLEAAVEYIKNDVDVEGLKGLDVRARRNFAVTALGTISKETKLWKENLENSLFNVLTLRRLMGLEDHEYLACSTGVALIRQNHLLDDIEAAIDYLKQKGFPDWEKRQIRSYPTKDDKRYRNDASRFTFEGTKTRAEKVCESVDSFIQTLSEWAVTLEASTVPLP